MLTRVCVLLVFVCGVALALKCYTCGGTDDCATNPTSSNALDCGSVAGILGSDACSKTVTDDGKVVRACVSKSVCLGGVDGDCVKGDDGEQICCCNSDKCNAAPSPFGATRILFIVVTIVIAKFVVA